MTAETAGRRKVRWSIEAAVLDQFHARVPRGQQSSYVTTALRRQLERDALADLVAELIEANGPLDEDAVARFGGAIVESSRVVYDGPG